MEEEKIFKDFIRGAKNLNNAIKRDLLKKCTRGNKKRNSIQSKLQ